MNKGVKVFAKVIYYMMISILGIFLAIMLPRNYYYTMPFETIDESLKNGEYENAIRLIGGYYDSKYVCTKDNDGKKLVIFATAILESDEDVDNAKIKTAYSGFLFNVKNDYDVKGEEDNRTKLICKPSVGESYKYKLINYDYDMNEKNDSIMSLVEYDFVYFGITNEMISDINELEFVDKLGKTYVKFSDLNLSFSESFFNDVSDFVNEYNKDYNSLKLGDLDKEFRLKSENYKMGYFNDIRKKADTKASIIVVIYFVVAFIIGDMLVGKRFIIKMIKNLIIKIKKKKNPNYETEDLKEFNDYYTQLTIKLIVPTDCEASFIISYHNEHDSIEFMISKADNYKVTKRVHAGVYVNAFIECEGYSSVNAPTKLEVKGFTKTYEIEFVKNVKN